jgi:hypothetical protein
MRNFRVTHKVLIEEIKKSIKEEMNFKIGIIKIDETYFNNNFTVSYQKDEYEIEFNATHKKMFFKKSENLKEAFHSIFLKHIDICELDEVYTVEGKWYIFLSIMLEVISEISIPNFKQNKEYKIRSLYDKKFERFFDNLSCLYAKKINEFNYSKYIN